MKLQIINGNITNIETGETIARKDAYEKISEYSDMRWAKMYSEMLLEDKVQLTPKQSLLLWFCVAKMNTSGKIRMGKDEKISAALKTDSTARSVESNFLALQKMNLVYPTTDRAVYLMNPKYFAKYRTHSVIMLKYALMVVGGQLYQLKDYGLEEKGE